MTADPAPPPKPGTRRIDREHWLRAALETVAKHGGGKLRIDALAKSLNVTKGSFYHHFKDRQDFVDRMIEFWLERFNTYVIATVETLEGTPQERLRAIMELIRDEELDLYDLTFRAWAAQDPEIAVKVREADLARYGFLKSTFEEMGFEGAELELRTRIWLVFASAHSTVSFPETDALGEDFFLASHGFFVNGPQKP